MESSSFNFKHDWYQNDQKVVVTILAKNLANENIKVDFSPDSVNVCIRLPEQEENNLNLNLFGTILPDVCSYKLYASKVEITLMKDAGYRWESLVKKEDTSAKSETATKKEPKNWDKLAKGLTDEKDEESVESLFSKIYSDGNDDQKRAMIKSFYESGGTVLSTNWKEVSKEKVEVKPPEGVEFKKWH